MPLPRGHALSVSSGTFHSAVRRAASRAALEVTAGGGEGEAGAAWGIVDAGVITADVDGWCSVVGHRQLGMVFTVVATGAGHAGASEDAGPSAGSTGNPAGTDRGAAADLDFAREPSSGFAPYDALLPPLSAETTHRVTFTVEEVDVEVAPRGSAKSGGWGAELRGSSVTDGARVAPRRAWGSS